MKTIMNICYGREEHPLKYLDIHLPESDSFPVMIYFHGGGLESGDKTDQQLFFKYLTENGVAVVSVNYRVFPQAEYPDFILDAAEATAWVFKNISKYGKVDGIYIGGSSAGGYLSQMLCFDRRWLSEYGISPMDAAGFIHDAGQPTCHFNILKARGLDPRRVIIDDTSSLYHVGEDQNYPPMLIIVSDNDMENRYEQTMLLVSVLKHFGHSEKVFLKVMHGEHCAYNDAADENGQSVFGKIVYEFIKR